MLCDCSIQLQSYDIKAFPKFMHSTGIMFLFDLCYLCINNNFTFYFGRAQSVSAENFIAYIYMCVGDVAYA